MTSSEQDWRGELRTIAEKRGVSLVRFSCDEWLQLKQSRRGCKEFTIARRHESFDKIKIRSLCLVVGRAESEDFQLFVGVLSTKQAITTLETRIKVRRLQQLHLESASGFYEVAGTGNLNNHLETYVTKLSKGAGDAIIHMLSTDLRNQDAFHVILDAVRDVDPRAKSRALQLDAVQTVLRFFDLDINAEAAYLDISPEVDTALDGTNIQEANVILHDSRVIPGFELQSSDVTGRAIFVKGEEKMEVITANALPLEEVFGVDLIYLNRVRENMVMVQYKMLDRKGVSSDARWQHNVTPQLVDEIKRMNQFKLSDFPASDGFRLNSDPFYFKFVKRERTEGTRGMVLPLQHFESILNSPQAQGPNGGLRIDYDSLAGQYLRQTAFIELVRSGYIGSKPKATEVFEKLIRYVTENGKSAVVAIRSSLDRKKH